MYMYTRCWALFFFSLSRKIKVNFATTITANKYEWQLQRFDCLIDREKWCVVLANELRMF